VLGLKQSGSISSVGFELYTEMLREAVQTLRQEPIIKRDELPEADLPVPAFLPEDYVSEERDRLSLYRKMSLIEDEEDIASLQEELRDRRAASCARLQPVPHLADTLEPAARPDARHQQERRGLGAAGARRPLRR